MGMRLRTIPHLEPGLVKADVHPPTLKLADALLPFGKRPLLQGMQFRRAPGRGHRCVVKCVDWSVDRSVDWSVECSVVVSG